MLYEKIMRIKCICLQYVSLTLCYFSLVLALSPTDFFAQVPSDKSTTTLTALGKFSVQFSSCVSAGVRV